MKALTLWQPWASLVALGVKTIETRSWSSKYRGPLLIHAGVRIPGLARKGTLVVGDYNVERDDPRGSQPQYLLRGDLSWPYRLPLGAFVARANLVDVVPMVDVVQAEHQDGGYVEVGASHLTLWQPGAASTVDIADQRPYGDFRPGRFAWLLEDIDPFGAVPAKGRQGLWAPSPDVLGGWPER